jgi:hypothetical protein
MKQVLPKFRSPEIPNLCPIGEEGNKNGCCPRIISILVGFAGRGGDEDVLKKSTNKKINRTIT